MKVKLLASVVVNGKPQKEGAVVSCSQSDASYLIGNKLASPVEDKAEKSDKDEK